MEKSKGTILLVEDEKIVAMDIRKNLELLGYRVSAVIASGELAMQKISIEKPDIIIMDIYLAGQLDGIQTSALISEKYDIPVIFLTASSDETNVHRAKKVAPYGYLIKPFDLTDLKIRLEIALAKAESERRLKESKRLLFTTLQNINDAVIVTDTASKVTYMNGRAEKLTGCCNDCIGRDISEVLNLLEDIDNEGLIFLMSSSLPEKIDEIKKMKLLLPRDGAAIPIEIHSTAILDDNGCTTGNIYSFHDITLQREIEKTLLISRNFYLTLFEDFPAMIWRTNEHGKFNYFNQTLVNFIGADAGDLVGEAWLMGVHEEDRALVKYRLNESVTRRGRLEIEFRLKNKLNEYRYISCIASPYYSPPGKFAGYIGVCYDTTERKNMEISLERSKNLAEAAARTKSAFLANMSHEIRTPINGMVGTLEVLLDSRLDNEQKQFVHMAKRSALSLLNLLNNILEHSKLESGKYSIRKYSFSLRDLMQDSLVLFESEATLKGIQLKIEIPENLDDNYVSDPIKIGQVVNNLIGNALKFTKRGSVKVCIDRQKNESDTDELLFKVADTGIGISDEFRDHIFDSFTQGDSSLTKRFPGAGLGLTISKQIVELLNGRIWFESRLDSGSTFYFTIPIENSNLLAK